MIDTTTRILSKYMASEKQKTSGILFWTHRKFGIVWLLRPIVCIFSLWFRSIIHFCITLECVLTVDYFHIFFFTMFQNQRGISEIRAFVWKKASRLFILLYALLMMDISALAGYNVFSDNYRDETYPSQWIKIFISVALYTLVTLWGIYSITILPYQRLNSPQKCFQ